MSCAHVRKEEEETKHRRRLASSAVSAYEVASLLAGRGMRKKYAGEFCCIPSLESLLRPVWLSVCLSVATLQVGEDRVLQGGSAGTGCNVGETKVQHGFIWGYIPYTLLRLSYQLF